MTLNEFLNLDEAHEISSNQAKNLNEELSRTAVTDIPENHRQRVSEYLLCALNMDAVSSDIIPSLEQLRLSLEDAVSQ